MNPIGQCLVSISLAIARLSFVLKRKRRFKLKGTESSEIASLSRKLRHIQGILCAAEERLESADWETADWSWIEGISDVSESIEAAVDTWILEESWFRSHSDSVDTAGRKQGMFNNLRKTVPKLENWYRQSMLVRGDMIDTAPFGERYHQHRRLKVPVLKGDAVGIDSEANRVVRGLIGGEVRRLVVPLLGIGGVGKTTLAKKVYHDPAVERHFDLRFWISAAELYKNGDLHGNLRGQVKAMHPRKLQRYLLIVDDVWGADLWQFLKDLLPEGKNGSRIIITTRSNIVVESCSEELLFVQKLQPFSSEMSWRLFLSRANELRFCPELEHLCREALKTCGGLPLGIVELADMMSSMKEEDLSTWKNLEYAHELHSHPPINDCLKSVYQALALSFYDLPSYRTKLCFLYFSIFPKDSSIPTNKLFRLWVAEGFIEEEYGKTPEDVADKCLNVLIQRNLVQANTGLSGPVKFCRVHSLVHEMARLLANRIRFFHLLDGKKKKLSSKSRRLLVHYNVDYNVLLTGEDCNVRSVFLDNIGALSASFLVVLFERYKLLTLLDCENVQIEDLPYELGNLFHLKYLNLKNTKVRELPKSVGKLLNLQTLDLRNTPLVELPKEINKLQNLRHLLASRYDDKARLEFSTQGVMIKDGVGFLENLQTLWTVDAHLSGVGVIKRLMKLRYLRKLAISSVTKKAEIALCTTVPEMRHLEYLSLHAMNEDGFLNLQRISSPPPLLKHLVLKGRLQNCPSWISSLQNLSTLCLSHSKLSLSPLKYLSLLPNLESLWLHQAYQGQRLHFENGCFRKLKLLVLRDLSGLEDMVIEKDALTLLRDLRIGSSHLLYEVPFGIQYLSNLEELVFCDMPADFVLSMHPSKGSEYWKVEHVRSVLFWYRIEKRRYVSYANGEQDLVNRLLGSATNTCSIGQDEAPLSFYYCDVEEENADGRFNFSCDGNNVGEMSFSSSQQGTTTNQMSFSSGFYTDDFEE